MRTKDVPTDLEREPARPIEYGRWAQSSDRRHGMRDGRNRIPSLAEVKEILEAPGQAKMPTPYLEMLFSRARDMMEHERQWYIASTLTTRSQLAYLQSQASAARAALSHAENLREKAKVEVTDEDLRARHSAEELRSEVFIRLRRDAEREQRIAAAENNYLRVLAEIHAIELQIAQVRDSVQSRLSIARMRALRISAWLSARTATYWEGLVHGHRDGKHLAPLLPDLIPRLPLWVVPEEDESPDAMPVTQPLTGMEPQARPSAVDGHDDPADDTKDSQATDGPAHTPEPTGEAHGEESQGRQPLSAHRQ